MTGFFERIPLDGTPEFTRFSLLHFFVIVIFIIGVYLFIKYIHLLKDKAYEPIVRITFGVLLLLTNVTIFLHAYLEGLAWYWYLPEATCGWAVIFSGLALITKKRIFFVLSLYMGFGAVLTIFGSNVLEGPAKYNFYQFFFRHYGIVVAPIYLITLHGFKIYKKDFWTFFYITLSMTLLGFLTSTLVNQPDELNMFYTLYPEVNGTPLSFFHNIHPLLYLTVWLPIAALLGYLY